MPVKTAGAFACEDCQAPRTGKDQRDQGSSVEIATSDIGTDFRSRSEKKGGKVEVKGAATRKEGVEFGYSGSDGGGRWVNAGVSGGVSLDEMLSFKEE